jgi:exonuclease VII small subunit
MKGKGMNEQCKECHYEDAVELYKKAREILQEVRNDMGDWSNNLDYEQREYYGQFYDTDEEEETEEEDTPVTKRIG